MDNRIWLLGLSESNKFDGDSASLVEKLEETMLAIGARLSEVDNTSLIMNNLSFGVDSLSVTLHIQLLNMWCKFAQGLAVWNNSP